MIWPFTKKEPRKLSIIRRDHTKVKLAEWQSQQGYVSAAQRVWANSDFRLMMDVLQNEHPGFVVLPFGAPPEMRIATQARAEGYTMALANLEALSQYKKEPEELVATFEPEESE